MKILMMLAYISGNAPICTFDGFNYQCFYYSWSACEMAVRNMPMARCVVKP